MLLYKFLQFLGLLSNMFTIFVQYHNLCSLFIVFCWKLYLKCNCSRLIFYLGSRFPDKIFGIKYRNPVKLDKTRKV